jgi:NifU-like protein
MWKYSEAVYDHFFNPRNVGEIEDPDGVGEVGSMACGDALRLSFKLDGEGRIAQARFQTFGCGSAIASSSILTEMVKGKTLEEAAQITNEDIARELGGLPREKMHCSVMGREALEAAMIDYYRRLGKGVPCNLLRQGILVCRCFEVTRDTIREAILQNNLETVEDVTYYTKAGGGCTECHPQIEELLRECRQLRAAQELPRSLPLQQPAGDPPPAGGRAAPPVDAPSGPSTVEEAVYPEASAVTEEPAGPPAAADPSRPAAAASADEQMARVREVLEHEVAPALRQDGGDIELVGIYGGRIFVRLTGSCAACRASDVTIKGWVESTLREQLDENLEVVEVKS